MDNEYFQLAFKTGATKVIIIIIFIIIFITQNKHITNTLLKSDSLKNCKK